MCARRRSSFSLLAQRKGTKRKPKVSAKPKGPPFAGRPRGDCSALLGLCGSGRTRCAAFGRCAQTAARSQRTKHAVACPTKPCAARRLSRAPEEQCGRSLREHPSHALLRIGLRSSVRAEVSKPAHVTALRQAQGGRQGERGDAQREELA